MEWERRASDAAAAAERSKVTVTDECVQTDSRQSSKVQQSIVPAESSSKGTDLIEQGSSAASEQRVVELLTDMEQRVTFEHHLHRS